ncbi:MULTISPECIES: hypothetical protein [Microbacterium]|uniref:hypothetical protein n=1 Tax=Microbacterium TaxID=33882 RepID=UPI0011AF1BF4|nr:MULTISPECIES: hypothetical protein [Microbacterium]WJS90900.1 hypothetical protein NYQ11_16540 [Microbacterium testaceum]
MKKKSLLSVSGGAILTVLVASFLSAAPATAASPSEIEPSPATLTRSGGTVLESVGATRAEWEAEIESLVASDLPRTVTEQDGVTRYSFELTPQGEGVPTGYTMDYTVELHDDGAIVPMLAGGSNQHGPYLDLNQFDQDLVISGGAAAIGLAACAIPAVGWVSCAAITAALTIAAVALAHNGKCKGEFRIYLNRARDEPQYACVT